MRRGPSPHTVVLDGDRLDRGDPALAATLDV